MIQVVFVCVWLYGLLTTGFLSWQSAGGWVGAGGGLSYPLTLLGVDPRDTASTNSLYQGTSGQARNVLLVTLALEPPAPTPPMLMFLEQASRDRACPSCSVCAGDSQMRP